VSKKTGRAVSMPKTVQLVFDNKMLEEAFFEYKETHGFTSATEVLRHLIRQTPEYQKRINADTSTDKES